MHVALMLLLVAGPTGGAGSATDALQARDAEIRAALPPPGAEVTPEARRRLETIVTRAVDLPGMVESAMAKHWAQASEKQRKRLVGAFEGRFRKTSGTELDSYRSTKIDYLPEVDAGGGVVQVPTKVVVKGEPTEITYAMKREQEAWRVVDIIVDGVSTVQNYRASFNRIITKEGVDGLIQRLEKGGTGGSGTAAAKASPARP